MRGLAIAVAIASVISGCGGTPARARRSRGGDDGGEGIARSRPSHEAYEILSRTRVTFGRHELSASRARIQLWVEDLGRLGGTLRARVHRIAEDGASGAFSDVRIAIDGRGGIAHDPLSLCDDPDIDDLSPGRVVRHVLGSLAPWDGGTTGTVVLDVSEIEAPVELRYGRRGGDIRVRASGAVDLGSFAVSGWRLRSDADAHVQVEQTLDPDDALAARTRTRVEVLATVTDRSGRSRSGIVQIESDVVSRPAASSSSAPETCESGFDRDDVVAAVTAHRTEIQRCYERQLSHDPSLHGRLRVAMTVLPLGEVGGVRVTSDELGSPEVAECVEAVIRSMRFLEGPVTELDYEFPFVFEPAGDD